jgi:hypothetical protein
MKALLLLLLPLNVFAAEKDGSFFLSVKTEERGWLTSTFCLADQDERLRPFRDQHATFQLERHAAKKCGGSFGSAKLVEGTLQVTGICVKDADLSHYVLLSAGRLRCVK